ncbi:ribosomal prt S27 [Nucleospora cyclopteri]
MVNLQIPRDESKTHKKRRVFRTCKSYFMYVKCKDCGETVICFSHSQTSINCSQCSSLLVTPTGGKAKILEGNAIKQAENQY